MRPAMGRERRTEGEAGCDMRSMTRLTVIRRGAQLACIACFILSVVLIVRAIQIHGGLDEARLGGGLIGPLLATIGVIALVVHPASKW